MGSEFIDYVLLALIFAIIINILVKVLGSKCAGKEHMEKIQIQEEIQKGDAKKSLLDRIDRDDVHESAHDAVSRIIESKKKCPVDEMEDEMNMYMREVILRNRSNCGGEVFTNDEILDYQNNFFSFDNKINHSSSNEVDMVDKLNEIYTSNNNEITNKEGKKISDIFNELTQNKLNKQKSCLGGKCLVPPHSDAQHHSSAYKHKTHGGQSFSKYHWKYEDDNVNNGGKFYDDIEGSDSDFEHNMAL